MTHVAPRIVNNVSGVKRINDECYFFVAGAVVGDVGETSLLLRAL